jgi:hypothetical protein
MIVPVRLLGYSMDADSQYPIYLRLEVREWCYDTLTDVPTFSRNGEHVHAEFSCPQDEVAFFLRWG